MHHALFAVRSLLRVAVLVSVLTSVAWAQIPNVTDSTSTPIPGVGHDYIRDLVETVTPANGSVSVRIQAPIPKGRGLTIPFYFAYDSNGATHPEMFTGGNIVWAGNTGTVSGGGWSYSFPSLSYVLGERTQTEGTNHLQCYYSYDYVFQDPSGGRHPLNIAMMYNAPTSLNCDALNSDHTLVNKLNGGDGVYQAYMPPVYSGYGGVLVADPDGSVYTFGSPGPTGSAGAGYALPSTIEDRNGNIVTLNSGPLGYKDTVGRTALSSAHGFGVTNGATDTITVSGVTGSYGVTWQTPSLTGFSPNGTLLINPGGGECPTGMGTGGAGGPKISSITLPNGQQYQFGYDSATGLLSSIKYPTGEWVKYVWEVNQNSEFGVFADKDGIANQCEYKYGMPAVQYRYVSYDGSDPTQSPALKQSFTYTTNWNSTGNPVTWSSKETQVTTTVKPQNTSFETDYHYTSMTTPPQPDDQNIFAAQIPVESQVVEAGGLRTTNKLWYGDAYTLACQDVTLASGQPVMTYFTYGLGDQETGKYEYDFGSSCPATLPSSPPDGSMLRQTLTSYHVFPATTIFSSGPSIFDRPDTVTVEDAGGTAVAQTIYSYDNDVGNATNKTETCLSNCTADRVTGYTYNPDGQLASMKDARLKTTTYNYGTDDIYLSSITLPTTTLNNVAHSVGFQFDFTSGLLTQSTDQNQPPNPTTYGYDVLQRLNSVIYHDGGQTSYTYNDGSPTSTVQTQKSITSGLTYTGTQSLDGGGRVTQTKVTSPEGGVCVDTSYDGLGEKLSVSNPYTCGGGASNTTYTYDPLGRNADVSPNSAIKYPDGTHESINYSANTTTIVDGASKKKTLTTDALGRLIEVVEDPGGLNYTTIYTYDALNNLTSVTQGGQLPCTSGSTAVSRSFSYDSFSDLAGECNPESGSIGYTYDGNGNMETRTDLRGTTTYAYDELNRVLSKTYSDTSMVSACYAYDGYMAPWGDAMTNAVGQMTSSWSVQHDGTTVAASESYQFDNVGRPLLGRECTPATCGASNYPVAVAYNLLGNETGYSDPSASRSSTYDDADRLLTLTGNLPGLGNKSLVNVTSYGPVGMLTASLGNGLTESRGYNSRTWLQSLSVGSAYSLGLTYLGNGNVYTAIDSQNGSWTYQYDGANRLWNAGGAGQNFTYSYTADGSNGQFGNMTCSNTGNLPCTPPGLAYNASKNQISSSGYSYDPVGNLVTDNTHGYRYDLENRITCVQGTDGTCSSGSAVNYFYDASGRRVGKLQANMFEDYVYDAEGNITAVYDRNSTLLRSELYGGGRHVATLNGNGLFWNHADWLGTERVRTNSGGAASEWCKDTPYGMNLACNTPDQSPMHFTGKQRDNESGLDYFGARYNESFIGRFMTPDPGGLKVIKLDDPQTWNLYAYVRNNPMTLTDPTGLEDCGTNGADCNTPATIVTNAPAGNPGNVGKDHTGQNQYDPKKAGPEDPTNPGKPLSQNPVVKKGMDEAFMKTTNGTARSGLAEAGGTIELTNGKISIANKVDSVNSDKKANALGINPDDNTIAIFHTHGNAAEATPSPGDRNPNAQFPDFVRSKSALYVTVPHSATGNPSLNDYIQLQ